MEVFDLVVIGAGPGGYTAAIRAAHKGLRTAVIESGDAGGTCLNRGCVPTKALLHSAHLYNQIRNGDLFGLTGCDGIGFDFEKINGRKNDVVLRMRAGIEQLLKSAGVKIIRGRAVIKGTHTVTVKPRDAETDTADGGVFELRAEHIIIATGSKPNKLPAMPIATRFPENVITSDEALEEHAKLYRRILIVGGGVIGVEFAGIYNDLGCEVTVTDSLDSLLNRTDPDIYKNLTKLFTKRGIKVLTRALLQGIEKTDDGLICEIASFSAGSGEARKEISRKRIEVDGVLVCVGRSPVTDCLNERRDTFSEASDASVKASEQRDTLAGATGANTKVSEQRDTPAKVKLDERGYIVTDEFMRTSVPNIYAVGDCAADSPQLAHAAAAQGLNAVSHILGEKPAINMKAVPACVYSNPEIATAGLTVTDAEAKGIKVKTGKYIMSGNGKSIITDEDRGFIKLVFNAETNVLIGAQLMCARATDIIGELANAIVNGQTFGDLASVIRPHPTYAEGITDAVESLRRVL